MLSLQAEAQPHLTVESLTSQVDSLHIAEVSENPKTPININEFLFNPPSTPKTKKRPSTTPMKLSKVKKSKPRNCSPLYSPPSLKESNVLSKTDLKVHSSLLPLFDASEMEKKNQTSFKPKNCFLELIEETVNEANETYLSYLSSQVTPDNVFSTLFADAKNMKSCIPQEIINGVSYLVSRINEKTYGKNFSVVLIGRDCSISEIDWSSIKGSVRLIELSYSEALIGRDGKVYIPGKVYVNDEGKDSRFVFTREDVDINISNVEIHCI